MVGLRNKGKLKLKPWELAIFRVGGVSRDKVEEVATMIIHSQRGLRLRKLLVFAAIISLIPTLIIKHLTRVPVVSRPKHSALSITSLFDVSHNTAVAALDSPLERYSRRQLQEDTSTTAQRAISYEAELEVYLCNPSLNTDDNDVYHVVDEDVINAFNRLDRLGETSVGQIMVTTKTRRESEQDDCYKCSSDGMLQWHVKVIFGIATAAAAGTTPAVLAASANDYIAYSSDEFKTLLTAYINDEALDNLDTAHISPVDLSHDDVVVESVGWVVNFLPSGISSSVVSDAYGDGMNNDLEHDITGRGELWAWWVWVSYGLAVACCLGSLCCFVAKRRCEEPSGHEHEHIAYAQRERGVGGMHKMYRQEGGSTDQDFEANYQDYDEGEKEYKGIAKIMSIAPSFSGRKTKSFGSYSHSRSQQSGMRSGGPLGRSRSAGTAGGAFDVGGHDEFDGEEVTIDLPQTHPGYSFNFNIERGSTRGWGARR
ncbi:unnamed protein product [Choristocarpus tenellus]